MTLTDVLKLVRPNVQRLVPYSSARSEFKGSAQTFLDANESPYDSGYNRYPDPLQWELKKRLATIKQVKPENMFVGNGSDEAIDLLYRAFCAPGTHNAVLLPPTYGMYEVSANINDVAVINVSLNAAFQIHTEAVLQAVNGDTRLVFLCSPNNPTGNLLNHNAMLELLENTQCIVVVDEAYIDFAPEGSMLKYLDEYPNLVVLQTLSKAWGLAGLRVGLAFAHAEVIGVLNKIKPPYNINQATQQLALKALRDADSKSEHVAEVTAQRAVLRKQLAALPVVEKVYPSDANFLLVKFADAKATYDYLLKQGVVVRDRSRMPRCEGCLRITVGTPEENKQLLAALKTFANIAQPVTKP
jgi:histidinol-phosphate aminotransferase